MIHAVKGVSRKFACGPTAISSIFGISLEEAELMLRRERHMKRRVRGVTTNNMIRVACLLLRRRGIHKSAYYVELTPTNSQFRPFVREEHEYNYLARKFGRTRGWVPVAIFCGPARQMNHVVAYDHKRKLLCDTYSRGKKVHIQWHPAKNRRLWGVMMIPKEFLDG